MRMYVSSISDWLVAAASEDFLWKVTVEWPGVYTTSEKESDSNGSFETPIGYKNYSQLVSVSASSKETPPLFNGITDKLQCWRRWLPFCYL